ncbi:hypothetical protein KJ654_03165 [Patescibacteria group bacterium]|nr:hypothetical protein [Patescibacteria group bacterium]MBU1966697.1 hypothetical protein [Patescibacteria group bacterium]
MQTEQFSRTPIIEDKNARRRARVIVRTARRERAAGKKATRRGRAVENPPLSHEYAQEKAARTEIANRIEGLYDEIMEQWNNEKRIGTKPGFLPPADEGLVKGWIDNFKEALRQSDYPEIVQTWDKILALVEARRKINMERSRNGTVSGESADRKLFKSLVERNLPGVEVQKDRGGRVFVSTFESGIGQAVWKKMKQMAMRLGKKNDTYKGVFDDGVTMDYDGITLYNSRGGKDPRVREQIDWTQASGLSASWEPLPLLEPLNRVRRSLFGRPDPISPIGLIRFFEREGQAGDDSIPDKARVLVSSPEMWVNAYNEIRRMMIKQSRAVSKSTVAPIYVVHFMDRGLEQLTSNHRYFKRILPQMALAWVSNVLK